MNQSPESRSAAYNHPICPVLGTSEKHNADDMLTSTKLRGGPALPYPLALWESKARSSLFHWKILKIGLGYLWVQIR